MTPDLTTLMLALMSPDFLANLRTLIAALDLATADVIALPEPAEAYRLRPVSRIGLRCPKCHKMIADSHYSIHNGYCKTWAEWKRK